MPNDCCNNYQYAEQLYYFSDSSKELKHLLENSHLRTILTDLDRRVQNKEDISKLMKTLMSEPLYVEYVDECLKLVQDEGISTDL